MFPANTPIPPHASAPSPSGSDNSDSDDDTSFFPGLSSFLRPSAPPLQPDARNIITIRPAGPAPDATTNVPHNRVLTVSPVNNPKSSFPPVNPMCFMQRNPNDPRMSVPEASLSENEIELFRELTENDPTLFIHIHDGSLQRAVGNRWVHVRFLNNSLREQNFIAELQNRVRHSTGGALSPVQFYSVLVGHRAPVEFRPAFHRHPPLKEAVNIRLTPSDLNAALQSPVHAGEDDTAKQRATQRYRAADGLFQDLRATWNDTMQPNPGIDRNDPVAVAQDNERIRQLRAAGNFHELAITFNAMNPIPANWGELDSPAKQQLLDHRRDLALSFIKLHNPRFENKANERRDDLAVQIALSPFEASADYYFGLTHFQATPTQHIPIELALLNLIDQIFPPPGGGAPNLPTEADVHTQLTPHLPPRTDERVAQTIARLIHDALVKAHRRGNP